MIARPLGDSIPVGMMLLGNGWPVAGLLMTRAPEKKPLFGLSSSLKSPLRIAAVGTVTLLVCTWKKLTHSWAPKKNSLSLNIEPGTGPPKA